MRPSRVTTIRPVNARRGRAKRLVVVSALSGAMCLSGCAPTPRTLPPRDGVAVDAVIEPPGPEQAPAGTYRFEHMQSGARKLRGGSFPADALLFPVTPSGLKRAPEDVLGLRVGTVRVPQIAVEPESGKAGTRVLVTRLVAIEPTTRGAAPARFWFDANGDGDLTDDVVTPDHDARDFATSNRDIANLLTDFSTGTVLIGGQRRPYLWARHAETGSFYLFLAASGTQFNWRSAFALQIEMAPVLPADTKASEGSLAGTIRLGAREMPAKHLLLLTPTTQEPELRIDLNADGRLDEPPISLTRIAGGADGSLVRWSGGCTFVVTYRVGNQDVVQSMDASIDVRPPRPDVDGSTNYSIDYRGEWGRRGAVDLGRGPMQAILFDEMASGDYRGSQGGNDSGVRLLIDLNKDGKFSRGEAFDPSKPFRVLDARWIVRDLDALGASFRLERLNETNDAGVAAPRPR